MKKLLLFAAVAGLGLVSAAPPSKDGPDNGPREARRHYPPCSQTVTDRCLQVGGHWRHHWGHHHHHRHDRHYAAHGGGHMRAPAAAQHRMARHVRRAGERG